MEICGCGNILEAVRHQTRIPRKIYLRKQPIDEVARHWDLAFHRQADIDFITITHEQLLYVISPVLMWPIDVAQGPSLRVDPGLDTERQAVFTGIHRALLELLGYPLEASQAGAPQLPALPSGTRLQHFLGEHVPEPHQQTRTEHS